ncbi:hypothetical protein BLOT_000892 [Blomia tropicalis]|nr:hypothetical protein BLOT_000892 [Blomia tropicalis]
MYLTRLGNAAFKASLFSQAPKSDRVFIPSAVFLTLSGLSLSLFGLHQLDSSRKDLTAKRTKFIS